jgi:hypothetical protein
MEKPSMRPARPIAEDSFEKAREAFFGTGKTPGTNASPAEFLEPDGTVEDEFGGLFGKGRSQK